MQYKKVTICACTSRSFIDRDKVAKLTSVFNNKGYEVNVVADMCELFWNRSLKLKEIADTNIFACYPRAIQSQMDGCGLKANSLYDIRNNELQDVLSEFDISLSASEKQEADPEIVNQINDLPASPGTDAWFPVIDKSKCTNCGKCHDFCLFGVYSIEDKEVKVVNPHNCKNNCPACARICPSTAIIFPKYAKSPINGGTELEEVFSEDDMEAAYQKRLEYRLQQNRNRFSLLKKDKAAPAISGNILFDPKKKK